MAVNLLVPRRVKKPIDLILAVHANREINEMIHSDEG